MLPHGSIINRDRYLLFVLDLNGECERQCGDRHVQSRVHVPFMSTQQPSNAGTVSSRGHAQHCGPGIVGINCVN